MTNYYIVMGDIIKSGNYPTNQIYGSFQKIVSECNETLQAGILSPYTITLGDEFQGVAASLHKAVESIFFLEEARLYNQIDFKIRYVVHYGKIETPINIRIAHGMMGKGLTEARKMLTKKWRNKSRFLFELPDQKLCRQLNRLFSTLDSIIEEWRAKDFLLVIDMLAMESNKEVGIKHGKNRSQIWKRRKTLFVREYKTLKTVIYEMIKER